jgi:hypothetical protein
MEIVVSHSGQIKNLKHILNIIDLVGLDSTISHIEFRDLAIQTLTSHKGIHAEMNYVLIKLNV